MRAKVLNGLIIRMERATVVSPGTPRRCLGLPPAGLAEFQGSAASGQEDCQRGAGRDWVVLSEGVPLLGCDPR